MNVSLHGLFKILLASAAIAVLAFGAQAQLVVKAPKAPACSKIKDEAACNANDKCAWTIGKLRKTGACRASGKGAKAPQGRPAVDTMDMMKKSKGLPEQKYEAQ